MKKDPIYLDKENTVILQYATCFKEEYVLKYPLNDLKKDDVKFIVDKRIREIVEQRLKQFDYNHKEAFKEPLYFDEENRIPIRTVRLFTGLTAVEPLKKDNRGEPISFVKPGNNHHLAIYEDENGNKIPHLCTFWHAVERKKFGFPVIIDNPTLVWNTIIQDEDDKYPEEFLIKLPGDKWKLIISFQQNEMVLLGTSNENDLIKDLRTLSKNLFRVQKISMVSGGPINLWFRHHLETSINDTKSALKSKRFFNVQSISALEKLNPIKININRLGEVEML